MKNLINKVRDHGKKITIQLKRHHKKYLFGAFCCGVLAFLCVHMAGSVKNIFAGGPTVLVHPPQKTEIVLSGAAVLRYENFASLCRTGLSRDGGVDILCKGKEIEAVAFGAFSGYTNIHTLDLSNNKISSMDFYHEYGNNYGRISVKNLILSHNNISEVKTNFPTSYGLVLSANRQQFTFAEALKNTNVWSVINIEEEGTIDLSNNKISSIDDRAFSGLNLSGLYLQNNVLSNVTAQMFEGIISLKKLDLGWNYIIELNKGVLAIPRLEYLLIDGNCLSEDEVSDLSDNPYTSLAICGIKDGDPKCDEFTVSGQKACFNVEYDVYTPTSGEVNATLTLTGKGSFFDDYSDGTGFTVNGTKYFDVSRFKPHEQDIANKDSTRLFPATVTWIIPTCSVEYSTTNPTNSGVIAYLTGCSERLEVTNNSGANNSGKDYLFTGNGSFTFQFKDDYGNTGSTTATVDWIDHTKPTCNISYEFQLTSGNHSTLAKLVNCSESGNVINNSGSTEYRFLSSGNFKFEFQDLAGNTGSAEAIVSYVKNSGDIISLYNANKALSCRHYYKSGNSSQDYKLYVTTGTMYLYLNTSIEGTGIDSHILLTDDKLYQWGSSYSQYFGSGEGMYQIYKFNMENELASFFNDEDFYFICYPGINDMSIFNVPSNVTFRTQGHYSANNGTFFSVSIDDTIKAGENTNFVVKIMKDGATFKGYTGTVYFELTDRNGNIVDRDLYEFSEGRHYKFDESDRGRKTFSVKIKKEGAYVLKLYDSDNEYIEGSEIITVKSNGSSSSFKYDTYKFNPKYSDEMNKAYQYARYYNITTIDSIKDAGMGTGLNRIAMAKMLSQYAVNALGINNFNTSRNCTFKDVSSSLDRQYDYGVTRACQLGIMGINTPDNKFYPNGYVSRAEFATALSRLLFNTKDGLDKYYSTHISKLYKEGIIKNTDPKLREKRGYVMLMLMRASENFDD